jgi:hypothetical protein
MKNIWELLFSNIGIATGIFGGVAAVAVFIGNLYSLRKLKSDLRKADLEYEKLSIEVEELRSKRKKEQSPIAMATFADVEKYGIPEWLLRSPSDIEDGPLTGGFSQAPKHAPPVFIYFLVFAVFIVFCALIGVLIYFYGWMVIVYTVAGILILFGLAAGFLYLSDYRSYLRESVSESRQRISRKQEELKDVKDRVI